MRPIDPFGPSLCYAWGGQQVATAAAAVAVVAAVAVPEVRVGVCFERSPTLLGRPPPNADCGPCGVAPVLCMTPRAAPWFALDFDILFKEDLVRGTRGAVVNSACDHAAFLLAHAEGENPFDRSIFFDTAGEGKRLCIRNLLFIDRTAPHLVLGKLQNTTTLNLRLTSVSNIGIRVLPDCTPTQLLTVNLYRTYCPMTPPASARHPPSSVASSSVLVAKLTALGEVGNRRLEDLVRWPEDVPWEKCHLRPSRQGKDFFAKDPDNLVMMSPALHKAFDGSGGSLASIIIEPTEVVLPSTDSTSGTVSVRVYFKDNRLLNSLLVRPEACVEGDNRGDGPVSMVLTLSDPRPARFAAFLLFKAEFERQRAVASGLPDAWSPPTAVPNSSEGLTTLLTAGGYNLYLQLQGNCTYIAGMCIGA